MKVFVLLAALALGACAQYDAALSIVHDRAKNVNDRVMDDARFVTCNNVYSAESRYRTRHSITDETFNRFCGRDATVTR